jgi:energy-coupling factor transport system permease protein
VSSWVSPGPAAALLAALAAAALLADRIVSVATIAVVVLALCLRGPKGRRALYLWGTFVAAFWVGVLTPLLAAEGSHYLWEGPTVPVLGPLALTGEELESALLSALRLVAVGLAFAAYALLLDHDRLVQAAGVARRSALSVALATRLVPTLERDARGLIEALRGRGVDVTGVRGRATLLSPLLAGSLERGLNLAEAMEARGYGRQGATRAPRPRGRLDRLALVAAVAIMAAGALWL